MRKQDLFYPASVIQLEHLLSKLTSAVQLKRNASCPFTAPDVLHQVLSVQIKHCRFHPVSCLPCCTSVCSCSVCTLAEAGNCPAHRIVWGSTMAKLANHCSKDQTCPALTSLKLVLPLPVCLLLFFRQKDWGLAAIQNRSLVLVQPAENRLPDSANYMVSNEMEQSWK